MPYRGVRGVSRGGLGELAFPILRKFLAAFIAVGSMICLDKWLPIPNPQVKDGLFVGIVTIVYLLWVWIAFLLVRPRHPKKVR